MSDRPLYSVKMRASRDGAHISGAERIVAGKAAPETAAALVRRAMAHPKGTPDSISLKVVETSGILHIPALPVSTEVAATPEDGLAVAESLLRKAGIARASEIVAMLKGSRPMRGAMLVDADSLVRLEPDHERGVRATCMDAAGAQGRLPPTAKNHYAEAIVLASKVAAAPGIVAEICISDDPDYVTGYVASPGIGYRRITRMKEPGDPHGGRIFICRGISSSPDETIRFLEETPVLVEGATPLSGVGDSCWRDSIDSELKTMRGRGLWRSTRVLGGLPGTVASLAGRNVAVLSSNGYLGLAEDARVRRAAADAAMQYGAGTAGARLTTGTFPIHAELEERLAEFFGAEAALSFATGYMANVGAISAIAGKGDLILSDELNHASIIDGCRLSGADVSVYRHCDMGDLRGKLSQAGGYRRRLVVSDGVFSMDGDLAPLPELIALCREYGAISYIDDAHAVGVVGHGGRGLAEHFGCDRADITIGTLSKSLGSEGGFVCASRRVIDYLVNRSRPFIFSTAPSPTAVAAAIAALQILEDEPWRVGKLRGNVEFFTASLARRGIPAGTDSAIVPLILGDEKIAAEASARLMERNFMIPAIRYPTVPMGAARLRVAVSAAHGRDMLAAAAEAIADVLAAMR
ncbi:MAG: 8-amino-7-oxononanoate synthase [Kiritimatiellae bacterium]|nr:8-amino-7-oxononanoate synthase [Kiritimatiellia bacterium]